MSIDESNIELPEFIISLKSGDVVMSNTQFFPGYCILLSNPRVDSLNHLDRTKRLDFLNDMSLIGEVITEIFNPHRVNYAILGNKDPFLHAHIIPRYEWEEKNLREQTIWNYPQPILNAPQYTFCIEKHQSIQKQIKKQLSKR